MHRADEELRMKVAGFLQEMTGHAPTAAEIDDAVRGYVDQRAELADLRAHDLPEDKMQRALEAEQDSIIDDIRSGPRRKQIDPGTRNSQSRTNARLR